MIQTKPQSNPEDQPKCPHFSSKILWLTPGARARTNTLMKLLWHYESVVTALIKLFSCSQRRQSYCSGNYLAGPDRGKQRGGWITAGEKIQTSTEIDTENKWGPKRCHSRFSYRKSPNTNMCVYNILYMLYLLLRVCRLCVRTESRIYCQMYAASTSPCH